MEVIAIVHTLKTTISVICYISLKVFPFWLNVFIIGNVWRHFCEWVTVVSAKYHWRGCCYPFYIILSFSFLFLVQNLGKKSRKAEFNKNGRVWNTIRTLSRMKDTIGWVCLWECHCFWSKEWEILPGSKWLTGHADQKPWDFIQWYCVLKCIVIC